MVLNLILNINISLWLNRESEGKLIYSKVSKITNSKWDLAFKEQALIIEAFPINK